MAFPEGEKGGRGKKKNSNLQDESFSQATLTRARYVLRNNPIPEGQHYPQSCLDIMTGLMTLTDSDSLERAA